MPDSAPTWAEFAAGWQMGIYRDPVLCGVLAGLVLGYLGVFVILKRMVFVTAAVSQASGLGVALAFYTGILWGWHIPPVAGASLLALATALLFIAPTRAWGLSRDGLLGSVYLAAWALSVVVGDRIAQEAHDIDAILFGTAVLVRPDDVSLLALTSAIVISISIVTHRGVVFAAFDPEGARVQGLPVLALELLGGSLLALETAVATRALGVLPVFAFSVLPGMAALALRFNRVRTVLLTAALLGALAGGGGYLAAFWGNLPVGACQASMAAAFLGGAILLRRIR